jgi:alpha-tubulin suppressor-like RCC1 family protein
VLLVVSTSGTACFRTPLGDAPSPTTDGSADRLDALNLIGAEADVRADVPPDLRPDLASDGECAALAFASVSAGYQVACGLRTDGTIACWGDNYFGETTPPAGTFTSVSAGVYFACGLRADGTIACWGENTFGQATPPAGAFASVTAGGYFACGLRTVGTIACWGDNSYGQATAPTATGPHQG